MIEIIKTKKEQRTFGSLLVGSVFQFDPDFGYYMKVSQEDCISLPECFLQDEKQMSSRVVTLTNAKLTCEIL